MKVYENEVGKKDWLKSLANVCKVKCFSCWAMEARDSGKGNKNKKTL